MVITRKACKHTSFSSYADLSKKLKHGICTHITPVIVISCGHPEVSQIISKR